MMKLKEPESGITIQNRQFSMTSPQSVQYRTLLSTMVCTDVVDVRRLVRL